MKEAAALPRGGRHRAPLRPLPAMDLPFLVLVLTLVRVVIQHFLKTIVVQFVFEFVG